MRFKTIYICWSIYFYYNIKVCSPGSKALNKKISILYINITHFMASYNFAQILLLQLSIDKGMEWVINVYKGY